MIESGYMFVSRRLRGKAHGGDTVWDFGDEVGNEEGSGSIGEVIPFQP